MKPSIETSAFCNLKCKMCPYQHNEFKRGFMDFNLFKKLVDELAPLSDAINIFNRGEPFTYPHIWEAIDYVEATGTKIIIATNALLLDEKKLYKHLTNGLVVISCHAGNKETYKKITGTDGYDEVIRKAKYLQNNAPAGVEVRVKMVGMPENEGQIEVLKGIFTCVVDHVEDSNGENVNGYEECSQPDVCPTWEYDGKRTVCCRTDTEYTPENYELGKKRMLKSCGGCNIR